MVQLRLARELLEQAGVAEGVECGREECVKFQEVLGRDYQIVVISRDYFNAVIYGVQRHRETAVSCTCTMLEVTSL